MIIPGIPMIFLSYGLLDGSERIQRIAVDIADPGTFVVAMPCHSCTFEQVLFMKVVKEQMDFMSRDLVQDPQADSRKVEQMRQKRANEWENFKQNLREGAQPSKRSKRRRS